MFDNAEGMVFRPPSEANSFILRATIGCSHNRCSFCSMYRDVQFRARPLTEIEPIVRNTARRYPDLRRVFLADGNALVLSTEKLLEIISLLRLHFPKLARITCYGGPHDILRKSPEDLILLKQAGLRDPDVKLNETPAPRLKLELTQSVLEDRQPPAPQQPPAQVASAPKPAAPPAPKPAAPAPERAAKPAPQKAPAPRQDAKPAQQRTRREAPPTSETKPGETIPQRLPGLNQLFAPPEEVLAKAEMERRAAGAGAAA